MILLQSVSNDPIKLYINSQGGHVEAGDTIHDFIKFIRPEVHVIGTGWVASAGITIFLAARLTRPTRPRLTHDKFPLCLLAYNRACFPSHWCYPWRIN